MQIRILIVYAVFLVCTAPHSPCSDHLGSPNLEPGLAGRDDIVFFEDFESDDWKNHFSNVGKPDNLTMVTEPSFDGARALRVLLVRNGHYGTSVEFKYTAYGLTEPEESYFRYYVYLADNFEKMDKFPGFGGTYGVAGWGGRPSDGYNGWSARGMCKPADNGFMLHWYLYHADMTGKYGTGIPWDLGAARIQKNQWHCIEAYARMNTISGGKGNKDGILRGWVDDELMCDRTDIRFRHTDKLKIEKIWFNIYYGGSWVAPHEMNLYWDNIVVASERIKPANLETNAQRFLQQPGLKFGLAMTARARQFPPLFTLNGRMLRCRENVTQPKGVYVTRDGQSRLRIFVHGKQ